MPEIDDEIVNQRLAAYYRQVDRQAVRSGRGGCLPYSALRQAACWKQLSADDSAHLAACASCRRGVRRFRSELLRAAPGRVLHALRQPRRQANRGPSVRLVLAGGLAVCVIGAVLRVGQSDPISQLASAGHAANLTVAQAEMKGRYRLIDPSETEFRGGKDPSTPAAVTVDGPVFLPDEALQLRGSQALPPASTLLFSDDKLTEPLTVEDRNGAGYRVSPPQGNWPGGLHSWVLRRKSGHSRVATGTFQVPDAKGMLLVTAVVDRLQRRPLELAGALYLLGLEHKARELVAQQLPYLATEERRRQMARFGLPNGGGT